MPWAARSRIGTWSVVLAGAAVAALVLLGAGFATGVLTSAATFTDNWFLTASGVAVLASGAASVVAGALALVRAHDLSWTVVVATCLGLLVVATMLNEVAQGL